MSHQVRIDYNSISLECQSICEVASSQLCKMDSMLEQLEKSASRIFNEQAIEAIFNACGGSIRLANNIITKCFIIGKSQNLQTIDSNIVLEATNDLTFC